MCPSLLHLWLFVAQPAEVPNPTLEQLERATMMAEATPDSQTELESGLRAAQHHAVELGDDPDALMTLTEARLALVWTHVALAQTQSAAAAMDEVIRSAMGMEVPAGAFGPQVLELYDQRKSALEQAGTASIEINCDGCQVLINEHRSSNPSAPLYLGEYRVWVIAPDGAQAPAYFAIDLTELGAVEARDFQATEGPDSSGRASPPTNDLDDTKHARTRTGRMIPRWAEVLGATVGVGLLVTGAALNRLHGRCLGNVKDGEAGNVATCPVLYRNHPQDYVLLGVGGGLLAVSGVFLSIDEIRVGRARAHQAVLTWTFQF